MGVPFCLAKTLLACIVIGREFGRPFFCWRKAKVQGGLDETSLKGMMVNFVEVKDFRRSTLQKSNIATKNYIPFFLRECPYPNHHFGYPAVSFRGCKTDEVSIRLIDPK